MVPMPCTLRHGHAGLKPSTALCSLQMRGRAPGTLTRIGALGVRSTGGDPSQRADGAQSRTGQPQKMVLQGGLLSRQRRQMLSRCPLGLVSLGSSHCRVARLLEALVMSGNPWANIFLVLPLCGALPLLRTDGVGWQAGDKQVTNHLLQEHVQNKEKGRGH